MSFCSVLSAESDPASELRYPQTAEALGTYARPISKAAEAPVTWKDLEKVRDEFNSKFMELEAKVLQKVKELYAAKEASGAPSNKQVFENAEKDEEESAAKEASGELSNKNVLENVEQNKVECVAEDASGEPSNREDLQKADKDKEEFAAKEASGEPSKQEDLESAEKDREDFAAKGLLHLHLKAKVNEANCYAFKESTWDVTMFAFIHPLYHIHSFWTLLIGILNIAVQIWFCLLIEVHFTEKDDLDSQLVDARNWRRMKGHWNKYASDVGTSLAASVCREDSSIELSGAQLMMYKVAHDYVSDSLPFIEGYAVGPKLCFLCLSLWYVSSVWSELYECWLLFKALFHLPRAPHTSLRITEEGFAISDISIVRLFLFIMMTLVRIGIACLLFYSGSVWLAGTAEISDLILNAAALAFILEIDNILCSCMIPTQVLILVQNMEPVKTKYKRVSLDSVPVSSVTTKGSVHRLSKLCAHMPWHSFVCLFSMLSVAGFFYETRVLPQFDSLLDTVAAYCKKPTEFVVETHGPTGIVFTWEPAMNRSGKLFNDSLMAQVVQDMIEHGSSKDSRVMSSWLDFHTTAALPLEDFAGKYGVCEDFKHNQQYLKAPLQRALGNTTKQNCSDLSEEDCMKSDAIIRFACPETCGCTSPYSGFFSLEGCPISNCQEVNPVAWQMSRYEDIITVVLNSLPAWDSYWRSYVRVMEEKREDKNILESLSASVIRDRFIDLGCQAIKNISNEVKNAQAALNYFCKASSKRRSLQPFCPEQCGCSEADDSKFCPAKRTTSSSLCGDIIVSSASIVDCGGYLYKGSLDMSHAVGVYTCISKGYNGKNLYRYYDSSGVLWEIRWETQEHFDWGAWKAGSKIGFGGKAKWTLRSISRIPGKGAGAPLQERTHYFSVGGLQPYPTNDWIPLNGSNTVTRNIACATGALVHFLYKRYHILDEGSSSCPDGTSAIDDELACRDVVRGWGLQKLPYEGTIESPSDPPGCLIDSEGTGRVFYNTYSYGKQLGSSHPVCEVANGVRLVGEDRERWLCTWNHSHFSSFSQDEWYADWTRDFPKAWQTLLSRSNWSYLDSHRIVLYFTTYKDRGSSTLFGGVLTTDLAFVLTFPNGGMISSGTDAEAILLPSFLASFKWLPVSLLESLHAGSKFNVRFHKRAKHSWDISAGRCTTDLISNCFLSPNFPERYDNNNWCDATYSGKSPLQAMKFQTEPVWDHLTIQFFYSLEEYTYSGELGPTNLRIPRDSSFAKVYFYSDDLGRQRGFQLCEIEGCIYFQNWKDCPDTCTWDGFFCRDSGMNQSYSGFDNCMDFDHAKDRDGHGCKFYTANPHMCQYGISHLDNDQFIAREMCCACGGGSQNITHVPGRATTTTPVFGRPADSTSDSMT